MGLFFESSTAAALQHSSCTGCGRDLSALHLGACFCPDCGCKIAAVRHRPFAMVRRMLPLVHLGRGNVPDTGSIKGRTAILVGYANAMYHLGWRYERGSGAPRNLPEATRCYRKSARLGNLDAMIRLAPADCETPLPVVSITR